MMGFRFRQSIKVLPGLRINFGLRGISATVGPRGATVNFGPRGTHLNVGLPGTGMSYRARLDTPPSPVGQPSISPQPDPQHQTYPDSFNLQPIPDPNLLTQVIEFKSVDVASLGSKSLERVSALLEKLQRQRQTLSIERTRAEGDAVRAAKMAKKLAWLRQWIAPAALIARQDYNEDCADRLDALNEIKQSLVLGVEFAISDGAKKAFLNLTDAFDRVSHSTRIWDITSAQTVDRYRTRSAASQTLDMQPINFDRTYDSLMTTEFKPPRFINANGADLLLYPAFVMAQIGERVALLDIRQVEITVESTRFIVQDGDVPADAAVVASTWRYVNKDGGPDRRFSNNPTIPVAHYCKIFFRGEGLNEAWMISNAEAGIAFGESIRKYKESLTDSKADPDGIAPPSANEWPDLDIPDKPKSPPLDWTTPITFYGGVAVAAAIAFLVLGKFNPELLSSIKGVGNLLQWQRNAITSTEANLPALEGKLSNVTASESSLTRTEISEVQQLLKNLGFEPGPADGIVGVRTQKALANWAKTRGVPDANLDRTSLEMLRRIARGTRQGIRP